MVLRKVLRFFAMLKALLVLVRILESADENQAGIDRHMGGNWWWLLVVCFQGLYNRNYQRVFDENSLFLGGFRWMNCDLWFITILLHCSATHT